MIHNLLYFRSRSWECNECGQISNCVLACDKTIESSSCKNSDVTEVSFILSTEHSYIVAQLIL